VNGTTYTTSGVYTQTLTNAAGCDSTLTVNVTLNNTFNTITDVACGSYIYNGTTYTTSGVYMDTLTNAAGCDSIVTLNLTINMPTSSSMTETACGSYTLNGTTYNASGTYMQTLMNAAGCDSTITLNLTVNQPTTASMTVSECESFTYNGSTYTASGVYTEVLTNAAGCDSVVTINLTIIGLPNAVATDNGDLTITASAGTSYQWVHCATGLPIAGATSQTFTATVNGSYAVVVTNAGGCSDTSNCVLIDNIGIDELTDASIRVFPNPTHSDVTVTMTSADATIEVADAKGTLLQTINVKNGEKVDLSTYETGVYFLRIRTDNGSAIERVVKN
jgi:Ni,Fe-hydrogenase III small subunit